VTLVLVYHHLTRSDCVPSLNRLASLIDMDEKWRAAAVPLSFSGGAGGWTEADLHAKWHLEPSYRLVTVHQRYRQADRTDNGPIFCVIFRPVFSASRV